MNFDPQKFFIGIIDLFSILLPGAALVYVVRQLDIVDGLMPVTIEPGAESWLVFFFVSYLAGHLIYLVGATIDDGLYEPLQTGTYFGQIKQLKDGKPRPSARQRWVAGKFFKRSDDIALMRVLRIKALTLGEDRDAINAFQWCKARLSKHHPAGLASVERFEADSKFFRSFAVALLFLGLLLLASCRFVPAALCAVLLFPVLWRYINQRKRSIQQAYRLVLSLNDVNGTSGKIPKPAAGVPTHAGGVVYKRHGKAIKYLIVQAEKKRDEWVLPKGHIEPGEHPRETAVREVEEETGCWARIEAAIGNYRLGEGKNAPLTRLYLMELMSVDTEGDAKEQKRLRRQDRRKPEWKTLDEAKRELFTQSAEALDDADELCRGIKPEAKPS